MVTNRSATALRLSLVLLSLVFALGHVFYERDIALLAAVTFQVYLPGCLLARALGKHRAPHPVMRFIWVLACGLALTITLGGLARLLHVPIPHYLLLLHGVMALLAVLPARPDAASEPLWRFEWRNLPLYLLLALSCAVVLGVGIERNRFRFNGYEDQTVFVELANWLANDPDDPGIDSLRLGASSGATRWDFDGWTYNHAAWSYSSGVSAAQIIWYRLTPLFIWTVPLAIFGLAYVLTRNERSAILSAAALTLTGLMTLDSLVYQNSTLVIGQFSLFQINSLRTMATALGAPLALMAALTYLRRPAGSHLLLVILTGAALSILHARPIMTFLYSIGATTTLWWLAKPTRERLLQAVALGLVCALLFGMPFLQRFQRTRSLDVAAIAATEGSSAQASSIKEAGADEPNELASDPRGDLLALPGVPLVGDTYIVSPASVFYHPVIVVATVLGLLAGLSWRRSLAAKFVFASTATTLILLFTPGLTPLVTAMTSSTVIASLVFAIPVGIILGWAGNAALTALTRRLNPTLINAAVALLVACAMLALLFEPFPIPASARDQIRASNAMQIGRDVHPADLVMVETLRDVMPEAGRKIVLSPSAIGNFITEEIPHTLITGGRGQGNRTYAPTQRFMSETSPPAPWLDTRDLDFLYAAGVTHIVMSADHSRLPQLALQPRRFEHLASPPGYEIFRVNADALEPDSTDALFTEMNNLYADEPVGRWSGAAFDVGKPGSPNWQRMARRWQTLGDSDLATYGRAFSLLLAGDDVTALPIWQRLQQAFPAQAVLTDALAHTQTALGRPQTGKETLLAALGGADASARVLAARTLLTEPFYYLLDGGDLDRVLEITADERLAWGRLANYDQPDAIRARVVLLMTDSRWQTAEAWQNEIAGAEVDPRDLATRASLALVQGEVERALDILWPATDPDATAANRFLHSDRWQDNVAARLYVQLRTELAARAEQPPDTASLLAIVQTGQLYVIEPHVSATAGVVTVTATFGNHHLRPFPVREWRVELVSPDASTLYARADREATFTPGELTRVSFTLDVPDNVPPDTPALAVIKALYDDRVVFPTAFVPLTLNEQNAGS